jgi:hypothetical protein
MADQSSRADVHGVTGVDQEISPLDNLEAVRAAQQKSLLRAEGGMRRDLCT